MGEGDSLEDPTSPWEGEHAVVTLGELELTGVIDAPETPEQPLVMDPMRLTDGIEPSDDKILAARPDLLPGGAGIAVLVEQQRSR